jgi:peptidoglycan-associated lipoprotein
MKRQVTSSVLLGLFVGLTISPLAGCARKVATIEPREQTAMIGDTVGATAEKAAAGAGSGRNTGAGQSEPLDTPGSGRMALSNKSGDTGTTEVVEGSRTSLGLLPVYFDFDKSMIRPDQTERVRANAMRLKSDPSLRLRIEGNCDERGTHVYNLALGELRAMSAKKYLVNLGVEDARLTTLSYGEERPVNPGQNETAWAENRRDDFVIVR